MNELDIHDPFRHLRSMERRMKGFFSDFPVYFDTEQDTRIPLVDVVNKPNAFEITAELPGIEKKDIQLSVDEHGLSLRAKTAAEATTEDKEKGYYHHERSYASFARSIPLPVEIMADKVEAEFKNGVLKVTLPKKHAKNKPGRKISIR